MTGLTMQVEANREAPRVSRRQLAELESQLGDRFHDVSLVLSELVTNSVRHAEGTSEIVVAVDVHDHVVRLEVRDQGPGFDAAAPRGTGMGLDIVEQVSSRWGVHRKAGFTVWAEIAR